MDVVESLPRGAGPAEGGVILAPRDVARWLRSGGHSTRGGDDAQQVDMATCSQRDIGPSTHVPRVPQAQAVEKLRRGASHPAWPVRCARDIREPGEWQA